MFVCSILAGKLLYCFNEGYISVITTIRFFNLFLVKYLFTVLHVTLTVQCWTYFGVLHNHRKTTTNFAYLIGYQTLNNRNLITLSIRFKIHWFI